VRDPFERIRNCLRSSLLTPLHSDRVIIFGRYPVPGKTKTRLGSKLGPVAAADLQRQFFEKTLRTSRTFASERNIGVEVCVEGGHASEVRRWLGTGLIFSQQGPGDLGLRMHKAFRDAFHRGCQRVVLLGTDIPELEVSHLSQAFDVLCGKDLVLGPSTDGGYWLMGLKRPVDLFQGIGWGSAKVLEQTLDLAKAKGLTVGLLDPLTDMDTVEDLRKWRPEGMDHRPFMSVIIPALNEGANIQEAILAGRTEDVEIIVVDGGSEDDTVERAAEAGARLIQSNRGRASQQNQGAAVSRGRVLLFLHADSHLPAGYVRYVFDALLDPRTVAGAFRFTTDLNHPLMTVIEFGTNIRSRYFKLPYGDQALFVKKSVFQSLGGFPEVPIAEDLLLVRQLSRRGRIRILPARVITSGRRWRALGLLRTTLINQIILVGCYLGVSPRTLKALYRNPMKNYETSGLRNGRP
jgi:rSAM/selenodomain-associated transferase 2/rSAM/selenodomain-associated transferase 1